MLTSPSKPCTEHTSTNPPNRPPPLKLYSDTRSWMLELEQHPSKQQMQITAPLQARGWDQGPYCPKNGHGCSVLHRRHRWAESWAFRGTSHGFLRLQLPLRLLGIYTGWAQAPQAGASRDGEPHSPMGSFTPKPSLRSCTVMKRGRSSGPSLLLPPSPHPFQLRQPARQRPVRASPGWQPPSSHPGGPL